MKQETGYERDDGADQKHVGAVIQSLREAYGWRLGKFAEAIGTTHSHLSNIESGRKRCTPEMARKIAVTLGVPLAAVTTGRPIDEIA